MNDLATLLDRAAGPTDAAPGDPQRDLARGHRALARTRARRTAAGLVGVAAAGALGVGLAQHLDGDDVPVAHERRTTPAPSTAAAFLAQPLEAGPYAFATTPRGWVVQGVTATTVTIARAGDTSSPDRFEGKLVIMLDGNPPAGQERVVGGRTFWVAASGADGYGRVTTGTREGEPAGFVSVQYPLDTGWSEAEVLAFLGSVSVGEGAQQGAG